MTVPSLGVSEVAPGSMEMMATDLANKSDIHKLRKTRPGRTLNFILEARAGLGDFFFPLRGSFCDLANFGVLLMSDGEAEGERHCFQPR